MVSVELTVPNDLSGRTLDSLWFPFLLLSSGHWPDGSWQPLWGAHSADARVFNTALHEHAALLPTLPFVTFS